MLLSSILNAILERSSLITECVHFTSRLRLDCGPCCKYNDSPPIAVGVGRCIFCGTLMRQLTLPHSIGRIPTAITDRILSVITSQARSADMIFLGRRRGKNDTHVNRVPDAFARNVKCIRRR